MAYAKGIFPMANHRYSKEISWYQPKNRGIMPMAAMHISRSLKRKIKNQHFLVTFDKAFEAVLSHCQNRYETWINDELFQTYVILHEAGYAHSTEVWKNGQLAGGVIGVALKGAFFGDTMVSLQTDASKFALVALCAVLLSTGYELFDTQFISDHLRTLGAIEITNCDYQIRLQSALRKAVQPCWNFSCVQVAEAMNHQIIQPKSQTS